MRPVQQIAKYWSRARNVHPGKNISIGPIVWWYAIQQNDFVFTGSESLVHEHGLQFERTQCPVINNEVISL